MLRVEILTPETLFLETEGEEVVIPTEGGVLGVRTGHLPLVAPLKAGQVSIKKAGSHKELELSGGFVEILPDSVRIFADQIL